MAYCGPKGIPLSTFLSWPVDDQVAALGWQAEENLRCSRCGTAGWEWEDDPDAYRVDETICKGCSLLQAAAKAADERVAGTKFSRSELMPGLQQTLVRRR